MTVLSCRSIVENDGVLTLTLNGIYATITVSDSILFVREILDETTKTYIIVGTYEARVLSVDNSNGYTIITINATDNL